MNKFFKFPSVNFLIGKPNSGKTETIKYIIKRFFKTGDIHYVVVICSIAVRDKYNWLPDSYVYTCFSEEVLHKIMLLNNCLNKKSETPINCALVFDDIGSYSDRFTKRCPVMIKLFTEHKNFNMTVFVALQSPDLIRNGTILSNVNYAWIYQLHEEDDFKAVFKHYGQKFKEYKDFKDFLDKNTGEHKIVVNVRDNNTKPFEIYRHDKPRDFYLDY